MRATRSVVHLLVMLVVDYLSYGLCSIIIPTLLLKFTCANDTPFSPTNAMMSNFTNTTDTAVVTSCASFYLGSLNSLGLVSSFFASPTMGFASDRYGRKPLLLVSLIGGQMGFFSLLLLGFIFSVVPLLFIAYCMRGTLNQTVTHSRAALVDLSEDNALLIKERIGLAGACIGVGLIVGSALSAGVGTLLNHMFPLILSIFMHICLSGSLYFFKDPTGKDLRWPSLEILLSALNPFRAIVTLVQLPGAAVPLFVYWCLNMSTAAVNYNWVLWSHTKFQFTVMQQSIALCIVGVSGAICQGLLLKPCLKRMKASTLLLVGVGIKLSVFILFLVAPTDRPDIFIPLIYVGCVLFGAALFAVPILISRISQLGQGVAVAQILGGTESFRLTSEILGSFSSYLFGFTMRVWSFYDSPIYLALLFTTIAFAVSFVYPHLIDSEEPTVSIVIVDPTAMM